MRKKKRVADTAPGPRDRTQIVAGVSAFVASAVFAWCAAGGPNAAGNVNSDTLLSALISIDNYTPYYWDQNSFGMLLPWITQPIREYGWNLLTQMFLHTLCGLASLWLMSRWIFDSRRPAIRNAWLYAVPLGFVVYRHEAKAADLLFQCQPYVPSMALGLAALVVLFRSPRISLSLRAPAAALLFFMSIWVNASVVPLWLGLAVGELWVTRRTTKPWKEVVITAATLVAVYRAVGIWASHYPARLDKELISWNLYGENLRRVLNDADKTYVAVWLLPVTVAIGIVMWKTNPFVPTEKAASVRRLLVAVLVSTLYIPLVAASEWVYLNLSDSRYLTIPFFMIIFGSALLIVEALESRLTALSKGLTEVLPPLTVIACAGLAFGYPTPSLAVERLAAQEDGALLETQSAGCDVLAGNYFRVWRIIFRAKVRHSPQELIALTVRSERQSRQTKSLDPQTARWCAVCDDPQFAFELSRRQIPVPALEGRVGSICWYRSPVPPAP